MSKYFEVVDSEGKVLGTSKTLKHAREIQAMYSPIKIRTVDPVVCQFCKRRFTKRRPNEGWHRNCHGSCFAKAYPQHAGVCNEEAERRIQCKS